MNSLHKLWSEKLDSARENMSRHKGMRGCLIIGFLSGLNWREGGWMSPSAKLLLTTGFCGGFTTFSTFMNEGAGLMKEENYLYMMLYLFGSLALGLIAVLAGHYLAKMIA